MRVVYGDMSLAEMKLLVDAENQFLLTTEFGDTTTSKIAFGLAHKFVENKANKGTILVNNLGALREFVDGLNEMHCADMADGSIYFLNSEHELQLMRVKLVSDEDEGSGDSAQAIIDYLFGGGDKS